MHLESASVLVVNSGSSSLKAALITREGKKVATFVGERLDCKDAVLTKTFQYEDSIVDQIPNVSHEEALDIVLDVLRQRNWLGSLIATGHRVVHGGTIFSESTIVDNNNLPLLESLDSLAPLHNPHNVAGIRAAMKCFKHVPAVAVFDTAFHNTMPARARRYPLPDEYSEFQKYGFHGTSIRYLSKQVNQHSNVIVCHLGNGASVTAVVDGKSVETSMGFSPTAGLMMGTRSGDVDATVVEYAVKHLQKSVADVMHDMNHKSGLKAIAGGSDMREILMDRCNDPRKQLAIDMFVYRLAQFIARSAVALPGPADAIVFSAGIGENSPDIRRECLQLLQTTLYPNLILDNERNEESGQRSRGAITAQGSTPVVYVLSTDEEAEIASDCFALVCNKK